MWLIIYRNLLFGSVSRACQHINDCLVHKSKKHDCDEEDTIPLESFYVDMDITLEYQTKDRENTLEYQTKVRENTLEYQTKDRENTLEYHTKDRENTLEYQTKDRENTQEHETKDRENTLEHETKDREKEKLSSNKQIFLERRNQRIILTELSGSWKSTFYTKLVNTWCMEEAMKKNEI
ncbi:hypothetical protein CHS0354_024667, partial [Potamilus streckersoni]